MSHSSSAPHESDSIRLLGVCVIILFVLTAVFWLLYPNKEKGNFSVVQWTEYPTYTPDPVNGTIHFGIAISSAELTKQSYGIDIELDRNGVGTKTIELEPGTTKEMEYSIPAKSQNDQNVEVRIIVTKQGVKDAIPLELIAWVTILAHST